MDSKQLVMVRVDNRQVGISKDKGHRASEKFLNAENSAMVQAKL